jgi:hypothetical protein
MWQKSKKEREVKNDEKSSFSIVTVFDGDTSVCVRSEWLRGANFFPL